MKKLLLLSIIIIPLLVFGILILNNKSTTPQKSGAQNFVSSPSPTPNSIDINGFKVSWYEINNIDNLKLIPNFTEKLSSKEIIAQNNCKFLSNSAFYSKDNQPLGLIVANNQTIANWRENPLFDGILSINDMATPRITRSIPQDRLVTAIQTGPILKENNQFQTLKIQNDYESRRVVAAITGENKLFFLSIYNPDSQFSGPFLADLPNALKSFEQKSGIIFADIVNLDGGAASTFNAEGESLSELSPVGAFFCQL